MYRCTKCHDEIPPKRYALGYELCMDCGEELARKRVRTVVPMHKSNYVLVTDLTLLAQLTRPGRGLGG